MIPATLTSHGQLPALVPRHLRSTRPDLLSIAHCQRTDPPEVGLRSCLAVLNDGPVAAIAYSDEPVEVDPPSDLNERFVAARNAAAEFGVHLIDWIMCDDTLLRSMRCTIGTPSDWWDIPVPDG